MLTTEIFRDVMDYCPDTGFLTWRVRPREHFKTENAWATWNSKYAGERAGGVNRTGHRSVKLFYRLYQAHRIAWFLHNGTWPEDEIDHINGNPDDNRIVNLRCVSNAQNCKNRKRSSNNTSGVTGVSWNTWSQCWVAFVRMGGRHRQIGRFVNFEDAVSARKEAERDLGYHPNHDREGALA